MRRHLLTLFLVSVSSITLMNGCGDDEPAMSEPEVTTTSSPTPTPSATPSGPAWQDVFFLAGSDMVSTDCLSPSNYDLDIENDGDYMLRHLGSDCNNHWMGRIDETDLASLNVRATKVAIGQRGEPACNGQISLEPRIVKIDPANGSEVQVYANGAPDGECIAGDREDVIALRDELERLAEKIIDRPN